MVVEISLQRRGGRNLPLAYGLHIHFKTSLSLRDFTNTGWDDKLNNRCSIETEMLSSWASIQFLGVLRNKDPLEVEDLAITLGAAEIS